MRMHASNLIKEISKYHQLFNSVSNSCTNLFFFAELCLLKEEKTDKELCLPALTSIGYFCLYSGSLALEISTPHNVMVLKKALIDKDLPFNIKATAAWNFGQLGKHSPHHAAKLIEQNVIELLISVHVKGGNEELNKNSKKSFRCIIEKVCKFPFCSFFNIFC